MERVPVVVVGAGQAGLATSHELTARGIRHVVLERGRIGETWRTRRWCSFRLVSPNWLNRLPGYWYDGPDPDGFFSTVEMLDYLEGYARSFAAPVRAGVTVGRLEWVAGDEGTGDGRRGAPADRPVRSPASDGFRLDTSAGALAAEAVVVATGAFGEPSVPSIAASLPPGIRSLHTDGYWAPEDLPPGGVLVVGAGQSGLQIADELLRAGRRVVVAVGRHGWVPRTVYGRDQMWWRLENGDFATVVGDPDRPSAGYPFTALSRWGTEDFTVRTVWQSGARLAGRVSSIEGGVVSFADDLESTLQAGDEYARTFVGRVRDFARDRGEDLPESETQLASAWRAGEIPGGLASLDLLVEGFSTVIWATGYRHDFSWIAVPGAMSADGAPFQREGVSPVPGLYFVGLHRGWHAADGTVLGAGWLAEAVASAIAERLG